MKKVVRTTVLSLVTGALALSGASTASAQDLGLAMTGVPDLNALAEKGLVRVDQNTFNSVPGLGNVQQAGVAGLESRTASEIASARGLVSSAVDKLPEVDSMDVSNLKAASVQNNSLVGPLNALCGPLADNANCSSTNVDKRLMGNIAHKDETLVGHGKAAF